DRRADQLKAVVRASFELAARETVFGEGGVEQVAGIVPGEGASRSIGAAQAGGQPYDQQANGFGTFGRQERANWSVEPAWLALTPAGDEAMQPRTEIEIGRRFGGAGLA